MTRFVAVLQDLGLLVARVALGAILIMHGADRWQRGVAAETGYLAQFATPYADVVAWAITLLEILGGAMLVVGVLTPVVAALVVVEQVLLISYTTWFEGWRLLEVDRSYAGGYEYQVALAALALLLTVFGAGRVAVDVAFRRRRRPLDDDVVGTRSSKTLAA